MRISDWSSDVCSSDLRRCCGPGSWWPDRMPTEFTLIDAIARRAATRDDVAPGLGDDAAFLAVPAGRPLVVAMDTLNGIGRASCRDSVCKYGYLSVVPVSLKKKTTNR